MKMRSSSHLLVLLLSLCASCSVFAVPRRDGKHVMLSKEDMLHASLAELLLSDLLQIENEVVEEDNFVAEGDPEKVHADLERATGVGSGPLLAPRERKAGCKNFFWKTFTSC
ncbi:somatostatin 1, tandem duplicate 1 [Dunckerocampus dactyliophorus]|uniref:somatostatin 1, tandem duplicate 1 n=1 Tax=Dunckerocampus dactyliophorus TaxID=161453 RepID=UPI0024051675|nr:somatostatin 1, tandem duplicate 1 [Dunckerocampus dactyliophorus]